MFGFAGSEPFHLEVGSPALATGDPSAPNLPATDLDGRPRTQTGPSGTPIVDMGVYEGSVPASTTGGSPTFSMYPTPTTVTLAQTANYGMAGTVTLNIAPQNRFFGIISFQCSNLPTSILAACYFSPSTVAAAGDNTPLTVTLLIEDQSYVSALRPAESYYNSGSELRQVVSLAVALVLPLSAGALGGKRRWTLNKRLFLIVCCFSICLAIGTATSCGGASSSPSSGSSGGSAGTGGSGGAASNSYPVTITATASGNAKVTQTASITFSLPSS